MEPTNPLIPIVTVAGIIKVVTWIKLLVAKANVKIEGYAAIALAMVISIIWSIIDLYVGGTAISIPAIIKILPNAITMGIAAAVSFGIAVSGVMGQTIKHAATKPLL